MNKNGTTITIRFPADVYAEVASLAGRSDRSLTGQIVWLVRTALVAENSRVAAALRISLGKEFQETS